MVNAIFSKYQEVLLTMSVCKIDRQKYLMKDTQIPVGRKL